MEALSEQLAQHDLLWQRRRRKINSAIVFRFLADLKQGQGTSFRKVLMQRFLTAEHQVFALSSLCAARKLISPFFFLVLIRSLYKVATDFIGGKALWKGMYVYAVDGSKLTLPVQLKKYAYKASHRGKSPTALVSWLLDLRTGLPANVALTRHQNELKPVKNHLAQVPENSVIVYDRNFFCTEFIDEHRKAGIDFVARLSSNSFKAVQLFFRGKERDCIRLIKTKTGVCQLRLLKYRRKNETFVLATTLQDKDRFSLREIADLYRRRWRIEEDFKALKREICVEDFHSRSPHGVKQELYVSTLLLFFAQLLKGPINRISPGRPGSKARTVRHKGLALMAMRHVLQEPSDVEIARCLKALGKYRISNDFGRSFRRKSSRPRGWHPSGSYRRARKRREKKKLRP